MGDPARAQLSSYVGTSNNPAKIVIVWPTLASASRLATGVYVARILEVSSEDPHHSLHAYAAELF